MFWFGHNTATILPAAEVLASSPESPRLRPTRRERANRTAAPSSSHFLLCSCFMATAERLGAGRTRGGKIQFTGLVGSPPGGRFGHLGIRLFVLDNVVSDSERVPLHLSGPENAPLTGTEDLSVKSHLIKGQFTVCWLPKAQRASARAPMKSGLTGSFLLLLSF